MDDAAAGESTSRRMPTQSGSSTGDADASLSAAAASSSADVVQGGQLRERGIANPWNIFQHQYKNLGLTSTQLSRMYRYRKSK